MGERAFQERRRHERFKVRQGGFAAITPDLNTIGPIVNISRDGLAFWHSPGAGQIDPFFEIDILFVRHGYYIGKIASKIISHVDFNNETTAGSVPTRQSCVQFVKLTKDQTDRLEIFIELYADNHP